MEHALDGAQRQANEVMMKAKNEALKEREEAQKEERNKRKKFEETETRLVKKEEQIDGKSEELDKMKGKLEEQAEHLKKEREKAEKLVGDREKKLEEVASLSRDDAKNLLLKQIEEEFKDELIAHAKQLEKDMQEEVDAKSKQILADAFQAVTGVDVIVDDTPGSIVMSGFDPIRRYMAKITLERLVEDGRIHPARIEEMYAKVKEEVNLLIKELGEKAAFEVGVPGLPPNLLKILGRLKFRIAYGQNVLKHSMEVAFLAAEIAGMMGANVDLCKKAGLLHDIGKAVDHEVQGKHAFIGRDVLKKFGVQDEVVHCVEANEG